MSQCGDRPALKVKRGGEWKEWSYSQYHADIKRVAKSCIALGLEPHYGVSIIGFNSPEWALTFMGTIMVRGRERNREEGMCICTTLNISYSTCFSFGLFKSNILAPANFTPIQST